MPKLRDSLGQGSKDETSAHPITFVSHKLITTIVTVIYVVKDRNAALIKYQYQLPSIKCDTILTCFSPINMYVMPDTCYAWIKRAYVYVITRPGNKSMALCYLTFRCLSR